MRLRVRLLSWPLDNQSIGGKSVFHVAYENKERIMDGS